MMAFTSARVPHLSSRSGNASYRLYARLNMGRKYESKIHYLVENYPKFYSLGEVVCAVEGGDWRGSHVSG